MSGECVPVKRLDLKLTPDPSRTIMRFFWPGEERAKKIIDRVSSLSSDEISEIYYSIMQDFGPRHCDLLEVIMEHYHQAVFLASSKADHEVYTQFVVGSYFTMEYSFEAAALFNPSIVEFDDGKKTAPGDIRFLMSLRGVGEGHISSIVFRKGTISLDGSVKVDTPGPCIHRAQPYRLQKHDKETFFLKIIEMGAYQPIVDEIMETLPGSFTCDELYEGIQQFKHDQSKEAQFQQASKNLMWLGRSNYEIITDPTREGIDQFVLFPVSEAESHGMEDMRMVRFVEDDGSITYYGTYTAFNGEQILPQLFQAGPNGHAMVHTLRGMFAQNKGHAIFPRKIAGRYMMASRIDGENIYLLSSENIRFWNEAQMIRQPQYSWEFVQIGNCGSPIETDEGWLVLTHGVGAMRRYCLSAILLDREDPSKVIGRLGKPLLMPSASQLDGYVPNVIYSCGGLVHNRKLILPYGISDLSTEFAVVELDDVFTSME